MKRFQDNGFGRALTLFAGNPASGSSNGSMLLTRRGKAMAPLTLKAYKLDLACILQLMASGNAFDSEAEAAAFRARAEWAVARQSDAALRPPPPSGTVMDQLFSLTSEGVRELILGLQAAGYEPSTVRRRHAGFRAVWRNLVRLGMVEGDPFKGSVRHLPKVIKKFKPASARTWHYFSSHTPLEILKKLGLQPNTPAALRALRDLAMIYLFLFDGMKSGDLVQVVEGDYTPGGRLPATLEIVQRGKRRTVDLSPQSEQALATFISALYPPTAGSAAPSAAPVVKQNTRPLFRNKHGKKQISVRSMRRKVEEVQECLGLEPASPAQLRHAAIVSALAEGSDVVEAREVFRFSVRCSLAPYLALTEQWSRDLARARQEGTRPATQVVEVKRGNAAAVAASGQGANPLAPPIAPLRPNSPVGRAQPLNTPDAVGAANLQ